MKDRKFEEVKAALFDWGRDYIEEFLCYEYPFGEEKDVTDARLDAAKEEMSDGRLEEFYEKFCIK